MTNGYAELQVTSNFSFLRGASHPGELVREAARLGHTAIAIADRNTLAGVVRAYEEARRLEEEGHPIKLVTGARLVLQDGPDLLCFPTDRAAYGRLCRLLTLGNRRTEKGRCELFLRDVFAHGEGQIIAVVPPDDPDAAFEVRLAEVADAFRGRCYLAAALLYRGDDACRLEALAGLARRHAVRLVATNDVHYHEPGRRALQDVLTCIREHCTIDEAGFRLFANAEHHLKPAAAMARLFRRHPEALEATLEIAARCRFSLGELKYEYPDEIVPEGRTPQQHLEVLTWEGARWRYRNEVPQKVADQLRSELALIDRLSYAPYFLTVHDVVSFARSQEIECQGRGSAANSAVCYCLGITEIDPTKTELLFERFISAERKEPPDIDVDFEHERREEVIQYIYQKYGRERAGLAATVIRYRSRSAIREVGKALGLSMDAVGALADTVWGTNDGAIPEEHVREAGLDPADRRLMLALELTRILIGFPRHLSQHVGGFVIARGRLDELVPIGNAAMENRTVVEWDKDDLETLGLLKVDVLALGMLTCLRRAYALLKEHHGREVTTASIMQDEDPRVYDMLCRADSIGVFQVESRAQMSMLPRLRPRQYYDLVIQVAIVRPGPIQGDMVHPYLRRRDGREPVELPTTALKEVLAKTMGVPLFQEQAMRIAIVAAGFTPARADLLRRSMATFRNAGEVSRFKHEMIEGMVGNGYDRAFAERCFRQIEGFGTYGFPESHAASFALLAYVSAWIKCHYPAIFAAALLNSQPMGFYAPAQLVRDAREHGVEVRPVDINVSDWDCTVERLDRAPALDPREPKFAGARREAHALRLGFRQIKGCSEAAMRKLVEARGNGYLDIYDVWRRSGLDRRTLERLARADAFASMGLDRRAALWAVRGLEDSPPPLFAATSEMEPLRREPEAVLPPASLAEQMIDDYRSLSLSLRTHPLRLLRPRLQMQGIVTNDRLPHLAPGRLVHLAGLALIRQRPGSAKGVVFITIEDETGVANIVVWPQVFERFRRTAMSARLLQVSGRIQSESDVIHVVAARLRDLSPHLDSLGREDIGPRARDIVVHDRFQVKSRDFH